MKKLFNNFKALVYQETRYKYPVSKKALKQLAKNLHIEMPIHNKGVFIDCGAFDGCSIIKFKIANPNFDCISYEPNPKLWKYFKNLPTMLIKKGVSSENKTMDFRIDHIDADGSSLIPTKKILFNSPLEDSHITSIKIECVELSSVIAELANVYDCIVLKLDVEGAEYDILEDLISKNLLIKLYKLYVEFHWQKCNFPEERHQKLISELKQKVVFEDWDALDFATYKRSKIIQLRRNITIKKNFSKINSRKYKFIN